MARILVADDHADSRELFAMILRTAGHEVLSAADGKEVVELYRSERPDAAVIDVFMPGKDGADATVSKPLEPAPLLAAVDRVLGVTRDG